MYNNEFQLLQNAAKDPSLSSLTLIVALIVFGGAFSIKKNKTDNKSWYAKLNPDCFTHGFINVDKFDFTPQKQILNNNLWSNDRLQTKFSPVLKKQKIKS